MRFFPCVPALCTLFSASGANRKNDQRHAFEDALFHELDGVVPSDRRARSGLKTVVRVLREKLRPRGGSLLLGGTVDVPEHGFQTGMAGIFKHANADLFTVILPGNRAVVRSQAEVETHVLLQSHLKACYHDATIDAGEVISLDDLGACERTGQRNRADVNKTDTSDTLTQPLLSRQHGHEHEHDASTSRSSPSASIPSSGMAKEVRSTSNRALEHSNGSGALDSAPQSPDTPPSFSSQPKWAQRNPATDGSTVDGMPALVRQEAGARTPAHRRAAANKQNDRSPTSDKQAVLAFFENKATSLQVTTAEDVLKFNSTQLEEDHRFIQWAFPTDQRSRYAPDAPVLNGNEVVSLRRNAAVASGLKAVFDKMLAFYGLNNEGETLCVGNGQEFRVRCWLKPDSHHMLRMTRMLRSLTLLGKPNDAAKLAHFLVEAVNSLPLADRAVWSPILHHWEQALHLPMQLPAADDRYPSLLFPDAALSHSRAPMGPFHADESLKSALFKKQQEYLSKVHTDWPQPALIAHFTPPAIVGDYMAGRHLEARVGAPSQSCAIQCCAGFYFTAPQRSAELPSADPSLEPFEIHVDFANRSFGGAWKDNHGFAQEEIAFLENAGLGVIAQYAEHAAASGLQAGSLAPPGQRFGPAFATRINDVPAPIVVEGCVRIGEFAGYGRAASRLSPDEAVSRFEQRQPKTTNWLAIAAPDLRGYPDKEASRSRSFHDLFSTAHAGFDMARRIAGKKPLRVMTGQLGCGVFENDVVLSTAAQMLAAKLIGVQEINFHGYHDDPTNNEQFAALRTLIDDCHAQACKATPALKVSELACLVLRELEARRADLTLNNRY